MAIPGWTEPAFSVPVDYPIPRPLVITYQDTYRFGEMSKLIYLSHGSPVVVDRSSFRQIDFDIEVRNVFDIVLLDRIE